MAAIFSRTGELIRDVGSWEKEQLKKIYNNEEKQKNNTPKNTRRGRQSKNVKDNPLIYISRVSNEMSRKGPFWNVRVPFEGRRLCNSRFFDSEHGGNKGALKVATKCRNEWLDKIANGEVGPHY